MKYAQLHEDGTFSSDIPSLTPILWDDNNFCTVESLVKDEKAADFRVVQIVPVDPPAIDPIVETVERDGAEFIDGVLHYKWLVTPLSPEQIAANQAAAGAAMIAACDVALTTHLDATAQQRRYDNRITCALRAGYPGPFQAEGQAFALWMDTCNALAYQFLAEIHTGIRPLPTDPQQLIAEMPVMVWPVA